MSIQSEITQLNTNLDNCYAVCEGLGATMPANKNFDNLEDTIASIVRDVDYIINSGSLVWANPKIYLQSSGDQYIDTGITPTQNTYTKIKAQYITATNTGAIPLLVGRYSYNSRMFNIWANGADKRIAANFGDYGTGYLDDYVWSTTTPYTLELSQEGLYVDGVKASNIDTQSAFNTQVSVYLSAAHSATEATYTRGCQWKIYYNEFKESGILTRKLVPVPQGLVIGSFTCPSNGMFDIVNQQFYGNIGTGNFTYGKDY